MVTVKHEVFESKKKCICQTQINVFWSCLPFSRGCHFHGWLHNYNRGHWRGAVQDWADKRHPRTEGIRAEIHVRSASSIGLLIFGTFEYSSDADTNKEHTFYCNYYAPYLVFFKELDTDTQWWHNDIKPKRIAHASLLSCDVSLFGRLHPHI